MPHTMTAIRIIRFLDTATLMMIFCFPEEKNYGHKFHVSLKPSSVFPVVLLSLIYNSEFLLELVLLPSGTINQNQSYSQSKLFLKVSDEEVIRMCIFP